MPVAMTTTRVLLPLIMSRTGVPRIASQATVTGSGGIGDGNNQVLSAGRAVRSLFGPVDHDDNLRFLRSQLEEDRQRFQSVWNYDTINDVPLEGRFVWERLGGSPGDSPPASTAEASPSVGSNTSSDTTSVSSAAAESSSSSSTTESSELRLNSPKRMKQTTLPESFRKRKRPTSETRISNSPETKTRRLSSTSLSSATSS